MHARADLGHQRRKRGTRQASQRLRRNCSVDCEHPQAIQRHRRKLRGDTPPAQRASARVALENQPGRTANRQVTEIRQQDNPENESENRRLKRTSAYPRHVDVRQIRPLEMRESQQRNDHNDPDVGGSNNECRRNRGIERPTREHVQAQCEQERGPHRGGNLRSVGKNRPRADVIGHQCEGAQQRERYRQNERSWPAEIIGDEPAEEGVAVAHCATAANRLGQRGDGQLVHHSEHHQQDDSSQRPDCGKRNRKGKDSRADGFGQRQRERGPEGRQCVQLACQPGPGPT